MTPLISISGISTADVHLVSLCTYSAFDTLAKALNPAEAGQGQDPRRDQDQDQDHEQNPAGQARCAAGATIQLIGRDQETPLIEVEGPLLTDTHVGFKVKKTRACACFFPR